jgi:hypothetical protein
MPWLRLALLLPFVLAASAAQATPVTDGRFDALALRSTRLDIQEGHTGLAGARIWPHASTDRASSIALVLPVTLVDESDHGKHHRFGHLEDRDEAPFAFPEDPPPPAAYFPPPPGAPDWIFDVIDEIRASRSAFGPAEFGGIGLPPFHAWPSRFGRSEVHPKIGEPMPEPSTFALLSLGVIAMAARRR